MDIDGSYFFSDELEDLVLAQGKVHRAAPPLQDCCPDAEDPIEGETLPEDALRALRAFFGF